jgi:hypothetical protein
MAYGQEIRVRGVVRDAARGEAIEYANVVLRDADSVFVDGGATPADGAFALVAPKSGRHALFVTVIGYNGVTIGLDLRRDTVLGDILLDDASVALEGVAVTAANMTSGIDKRMVYPSERQVKAATNGIDILQQLMLPRVTVNTISNEVSIVGGGELQLRINGVKVEREDVSAIIPRDIIRIEYHDNPGLRYGNAEVVLDYIVRRRETGGNISVDLSDAVTAEWGNNSVSGKINHKRSEFSVYLDYNPRDFYSVWRDNEERFALDDGRVIHRREIGRPGHFYVPWGNANATYSYLGGRHRFSATMRYHGENNQEADYRGSLVNVDNPQEAVDMDDRSLHSLRRPALDLYYQYDMGSGQTVVLNAVGTYNETDDRRSYSESRDGAPLTLVDNAVSGRKRSYIAEGIYEKKIGEQRIGGGIRHTQSSSANTYVDESAKSVAVEQDQGETYAYGEFRGKAGKLDYTVGIGGTRAFFTQGGSGRYTYYTFNPRLVAQYALSSSSFVRLRSSVNRSAPSLSDLSDVGVLIDSLQVQRGNPTLLPYYRSASDLMYEVHKGIFFGSISGTYDYQPDAIMDEKYAENGKIIQTWNNQRSWERLNGSLTLRLGPIKDIVQLSVTSGVNHYISRGNTYLHRYTNFYTFANAAASYKGVSASVIVELPWNHFFGETLSGGERIHMATAGYKYRELSLTLGVLCPFSNNYKQESENRSSLASYKRTMYINESSRMVVLMARYNFTFGRKAIGAGERRLNNADDDAGVMSSGK